MGHIETTYIFMCVCAHILSFFNKTQKCTITLLISRELEAPPQTFFFLLIPVLEMEK